MPASPLLTLCTLLPPCPHPQVKVTTTSTPATVRLCILYSWCPLAFCWGTAKQVPHHTPFFFARGGGRG